MMELADFARGLTPESRRPAVDAHLASCSACSETVGFLRAIAEVAASDPKVEVPADLVKSAKAIFPVPRHAPLPLLQRVTASLVFNPFAEPLPAGVRSEHRPVRQMVYQAGDYCVDLRVDSERDSANVTLVGQIANQAVPTEPLARTPVMLMAGNRLVCETVSNDFGEFCLEYQPKSNLRLCLPLVNSGIQVEVALNRLFTKQ